MKKPFKIVLGLVAIAAMFIFKESSAEISTAFFGAAAAPSNDDLEKFAEENFSSFEGDIGIYTGEGDHFLNFSGAGGFANEGHNPRQFVMTITNNTAANQVCTLIPGYTWKPGDTDETRKVVVDGTMYRDGSSNTVDGAGSPKTIKEFLAFINANPTSLVGMKISSNNSATQLDQQMIISDLSPFRTLENKIINLSNFSDQNTYQDKKLTFPLNDVVIGAETEVTLPIMANSVCTIVFYCGGVFSNSSALRNKKALASANIASVGLGNIKQAVAARPAQASVVAGSARPLLG